MSSDYLLDTSVLIEVIKQNPTVQRQLASAGNLYVATVALGELFYGAKHSLHPEKGKSDVVTISQAMTLLAPDAATAEIYGDLKHELRVAGQMIPDNGLWIAATARQYGLTLATRDAHFSRLAGLAVESW